MRTHNFNISYMLWGCDSLLLIALSVFDIFVVFLLWLQYHHLSQKRSRKWRVLHSKSATRAQSKSIARHQNKTKSLSQSFHNPIQCFTWLTFRETLGVLKADPVFPICFVSKWLTRTAVSEICPVLNKNALAGSTLRATVLHQSRST